MLAAVLALASTAESAAQDGPAASPEPPVAPRIETDTIHWAYSAFLGTGYYRVSGDREVYVFDMPFSWRWRRAEISADRERTLGVSFEFPVTAGLHSIDPFDDPIDLDNLGTVSFTPGVEVDYPLDERWTLRAYGNFGWGTETSGDETAWIWHVGAKARRAFSRGAVDGGLIGEVFYAGYRADSSDSSGLGGFGIGADFRRPISWRTAAGDALDLTWDLTYRWYRDALTFRRQLGPETRIDDEWRIGVGLAPRGRRYRFWLFSWAQVGVGYRFSSGGEFRGVTVNFSVPFDR